MSGLLNSSLNGPASNLQDNSARSFATSFSAQSGAPSQVFHHSGECDQLNHFFFFRIENLATNLHPFTPKPKQNYTVYLQLQN